jgi:PD-(D/E)XK nuclease superfamily
MKTKRNTGLETFSERMVHLISETNFIRFEQVLTEPNIFKIVGRSHYERWHSCFWGWLLDPNGTHLLKNYPLIRLLLLLSDERTLKSSGKCKLLQNLPAIEFTDVEVTPNEFVSNERSVEGVGRFDIFLTAKYTNKISGEAGSLNVIFEFKIDTKPTKQQSSKYADWLLSAHPKDDNLLVYINPTLGQTSEETVGDKRWCCLDYQLLNDKLLTPLLEHPSLNDKTKPFIIQYVKNLKIRQKGIKMAITDEEKKMALALYEKYSDVFDSIYDALKAADVIEHSTSETGSTRGRARGRMAVKIAGKVFDGAMVMDIYEKVLKFIVDKDYIKKLPLPWGTTDTRYIITNQAPPVHPSGREFFSPVKYRHYAIETHYARERAMQVLNELCQKLELTFEKIET